MPLRRALFINALLVAPLLARPEAFEIGEHNVGQLPGGREADGIIGDFVLRKDRIEAVISGNQAGRKANMTTFWGGPVTGGLLDLCPRGGHNDRLTYFVPGRQSGRLPPLRTTRPADDGGLWIGVE